MTLRAWHTVTDGTRDDLTSRLATKGITHEPSWIENKRILVKNGLMIGILTATECEQRLKEWKL